MAMTCCDAKHYESTWDEKHAAKDLKRYRRKGPDKTTRLLLDAIVAQGISEASLLDIGGGIGVVHHELLDAGALTALHVDAALPNIRTARDEATRRGHADRVRFSHGDFVALAQTISPVDVVTLDRVICCYPDMRALVSASASKARRLYGAVFPRERWVTRVGLALGNFVRRLQRNPFRGYLHSIDSIDAELRQHGLTPRSVRETFLWRVAVYAR